MKKTINSIAAINLKGRNFSHTIAPLTVIAGDNATGKTAITDAIQVALLGYLPALGKKPSATMELAPATAKQLEAVATFSDGGKIRRTFTRSRTGAGADQAGEAPDIQPAQLSFAEFLNAKPTDRHAILNSLMGQIDYSALAERTKAKLAELGLMDKVAVTIDPQAEKPLEAAIEAIAQEGRQIKQSVDQARKTLATMVLTEAPVGVSPAAITIMEEALAAANETVGKASQELDALDRQLQKAPDEPTTPRPTDEALVEAAALVTDRKVQQREAALANAGREQNEAAIEKLVAEKHEISRTAPATLGSPPPEETKEALEEELLVLVSDIDLATALQMKAAKEAGEANKEAAMVAKQIQQLNAGICPCCGTTGEALEAARGLIEQHLRMVRDAATAAASLEEIESSRVAILKVHKVRVQRDLELIQGWAASNRIEEIEQEIATIKSKIDGLVDPKHAAMAVAQAEQEEAALILAALQWDQYHRANVPTEEQVTQAREALIDSRFNRKTIQAELEDLRASRAANDQYLAEQNRIAAIQEEAASMERTNGAIQELRTWLQDQQRAAAAEAMKPLIQTAGIFTAGLLEGDLTTDRHLVGITRGEQFLPLEVLSGMETLAVSAACQAALASKSGIRILIVDELARMTPKNQERFVANCQAAIEAGVIDQAILVAQTSMTSLEAHTILV